MAEIKVSLGTILSEQEQQSIDMTNVVRLTAQPPPGTDVRGQCYCGAHICPYCGCIGWDTGPQPPWHIVVCYCCGHPLRI